MKCSDNCDVDMDCIDCPSFDRLVERLAAYEDTGLTPESVEALKLSMIGKTISEITEFEGLPIERLKELARADREGRVVVLPFENGLNNPDRNKAFGHDAIEILTEVLYMPAADVAPVADRRKKP